MPFLEMSRIYIKRKDIYVHTYIHMVINGDNKLRI